MGVPNFERFLADYSAVAPAVWHCPYPKARRQDSGGTVLTEEAKVVSETKATVKSKPKKPETGQKWVDENGNIIWPPNDGFAGIPKPVELKPGTVFDRYGYDGGTFVSPKGEPYGNRSLAPGTEKKPYSVFRVVKPVEAMEGEVAPWFGEPGGATQ